MLRSVESPLGRDSMFGSVNVLGNELRDGPDRASSKLVGRFQGLFAGAGLMSPPGLMSSLNVVFSAGKYSGSTLALLGPLLDFEAPVERALVGGTRDFRMALDKIDLYVMIRPTNVVVVSRQMDSRRHAAQ
ncbi:dirigent protein 22-like [Brachypodium distachyon]|uniref:dirigent protein 22-like n=1 Tax=Brachypodium distachyon TaxID=15368 RepID=UPI000234E97A|nr:dirigent protein 22-like [Brachypodium distachyon]|eukprot:XP_003559937.1 dirigent protein 22-like [Brachypodium distachyon]